MTKRYPEISSSLIFAIIYSFVVAIPCLATEKPKRGDYPRCQELCVTRLGERLAELAESLRKTGKTLVYENLVEQSKEDFDGCIETCKQPHPVK
jgi:hypothetical protein